MGIAPIPGIRGVDSATASPAEREVEPPLALTRSDRLQEDAYKGSRGSADRGMEEQDEEPAENSNVDENSSIPENSNTRVSFSA